MGNHSNNHSIYAEHAKLEHNPIIQSRLIRANERRKSLRGKSSNYFGPEKVFGITKAWADENPNTLIAITKALIKAGKWLDETDASG